MNVPIIALNRGETKSKMCSTDIREKLSYYRTADIYDLDLNRVSPVFWKNRIRSPKDAKTYLVTKLNFQGQIGAEVWKFIPSRTTDKLISNGEICKNKSVLCLPGRTPCSLDRIRKIALTIQNDFLPKDRHNSTSIYIAIYEQNEYDTEHHLQKLKYNIDYFSDDAMIFTKLLMMPNVCQELSIEKNEDQWTITKNGQLEPIEVIVKKICNIVLFARSIGSVIAVEMENAFKYCMVNLGFSEEEIKTVGNQVSVLSICNLASFDIPRLFDTISITGSNDKKAQKYIKPSFEELATTKEVLFRRISETHLSVISPIPNKIIEIGTNKTIEDSNCHYTPLFTALRKDDSNVIPTYIRNVFKDMIEK